MGGRARVLLAAALGLLLGRRANHSRPASGVLSRACFNRRSLTPSSSPSSLPSSPAPARRPQDVVEPLESVSVTLTPTDKKNIQEFGDIKAVAETLAKEVLTAPGQEVEVVSTNEVRALGGGRRFRMRVYRGTTVASCSGLSEVRFLSSTHRPPTQPPLPPVQRETKGRTYYEFEFTAKNPRYTRHSVAVVTADAGKFYTLTTGANERCTSLTRPCSKPASPPAS
jgi:hypothetical protein